MSAGVSSVTARSRTDPSVTARAMSPPSSECRNRRQAGRGTAPILAAVSRGVKRHAAGPRGGGALRGPDVSAPAQLGVERVAQGIAEEVEAEDGEADRDAG